MAVTEADREAVRLRLQRDFVFYPESAAKILSSTGKVIPFKLKRAQRRMAERLMAQRESGEPMRAIVLKARKVGFSTQAQVLLVQRATQLPNHLAMTVSQDGDTGAEIFQIGRLAWAHLPAQIKPPLAYERNTDRHKFMQWGEPAQLMRRQGIMGLNSSYRVQSAGTAQVAAKGRGMTIRSLHMSEVAFWESEGKKLALVNAVPDDEDTLIVEESTANGHNSFKDDWDSAVEGSSGYIPIFTPWFEEEGYRRPFRSPEQRAQFESELGVGRYGEDEPALLELIPRRIREWEAEWDDRPLSDAQLRTRVLEHLHWRRWAISAKTESDVEKFHQEYPSTPEEAFLATGRRVFKPEYVAKVLARVDETDPAVPSRARPGPARGVLEGQLKKVVRAQRGVTIEVPQKAIWVPRSRMQPGQPPRWRLWDAPREKGQYIIGVDPESGEENEGATANSAICVIDHKTLRQVAVWEAGGVEPDEVALQVYLAALFYNRAWVAIERTGGWGTPHNQRIAREYHYPYVHRSTPADTRMRDEQKQLGWSTDPRTKPLMEARGNELLREEVDGIRDRRTATQMLTYVRNERGRSGPEPGKQADMLMAWLIAQAVAQERPIRPDRPAGAVNYTGNNARVRTRAVA